MTLTDTSGSFFAALARFTLFFDGQKTAVLMKSHPVSSSSYDMHVSSSSSDMYLRVSRCLLMILINFNPGTLHMICMYPPPHSYDMKCNPGTRTHTQAHDDVLSLSLSVSVSLCLCVWSWWWW
jgi:hypothetical protein